MLGWKKISPEILFNVHGGITFSDGLSCYPITRDRYLWWFGFDCAHYGDAKDLKAFNEYFPEKYKKYKELELLYDYGEVRTLDYVEQECRNLVEQIKYVEQVLKGEKS